MTIRRVIAIIAIYMLACAGWFILGAVTEYRSDEMSGRLGRAVEQLWGTRLVQRAPSFCTAIPGSDKVRWLIPEHNDVDVRLDLDFRKKGLVWYSTYVCQFDGRYVVANEEAVTQKVRFHFDFPAAGATYDAFDVSVDDAPVVTPVDTNQGVGEIVEIPPGERRVFRVTYRTRGLDSWRYRLAPNIGRVRTFSLTAHTNFAGVDYPDSSLSPMNVVARGEGKELHWEASDLITNQDIGVVCPTRINPGPLATRITFFAPVCLIFFFTLVAAINVVHRVRIHPMHYLFVAAGFFAFHLLLAYLVDHVDVHAAFLLSAVTSVTLVTTYLSAALGKEFPVSAAVGGQLFFLVLFSYSFFLEGATGLTVAIGSVVTLAVLMKVTAHMDWHAFFGGPSSEAMTAAEA